MSFNEAHGGASLSIPGFPEEEPEEVIEALREPMPLSSVWVLWEQMASGGYATRKVVSFKTVQEFWAIWNGLPQPSELLENKRLVRDTPNAPAAMIDAIMIFRDGILPEWEHAANAKGGHFQMQLKPSAGGGQIDEYWNNLVLGTIGNTMEAADLITGLRLVDKLSGKGKVTDAIRLELWYHSKASAQGVTQLKQSMERCLTARLDGTQGSALKADAIQDKKHSQMGK